MTGRKVKIISVHGLEYELGDQQGRTLFIPQSKQQNFIGSQYKEYKFLLSSNVVIYLMASINSISESC